AASLRVAANAPQHTGDLSEEELEKRMAGHDNAARSLAGQFEVPGESFQVSVSEALMFSNSDRIERDFLGDSSSLLVGRMKELTEPREAVEFAFWSVLARPPAEEELQATLAYLNSREDRRVEACRQIVWALMTGSEFRFNY